MSQSVALSHTFKHVFYEDAAFDDLLVGVELLVVGSDEEDHFFYEIGVEGVFGGRSDERLG